VGPNRVSRVFHYFQENQTLPPPRCRGRPKKVTQEILDFIDIRTLQEARLSLGELRAEIEQRFNTRFCNSTMRTIRSNLGFNYQPARHVQDLRDYQIEARTDFCRKMLQHPEEFALIHFSDESRFVLGDDKQWVWYRRGEENPSADAPTRKFPPSVMIFGVIGLGYKSKLLFIKGTVNAAKYIENLANLGFMEDLDEKYGALNWIFQQDGAPCHTAQEALDWIEENCDVICDWPANSPDLNPIELLWAILKHAVAKLAPQTVDELQQVLLRAWNSIPQTTVDALCGSFGPRLQMCLDLDGASISNHLWRCSDYAALLGWQLNQQRPPWTPADDSKLYELVRKVGHQWKAMAAYFPGRDSPDLKNRWHSVLARRERALLTDVDKMLAIRGKARNGEFVEEMTFDQV
jgi:transposase